MIKFLNFLSMAWLAVSFSNNLLAMENKSAEELQAALLEGDEKSAEEILDSSKNAPRNYPGGYAQIILDAVNGGSVENLTAVLKKTDINYFAQNNGMQILKNLPRAASESSASEMVDALNNYSWFGCAVDTAAFNGDDLAFREAATTKKELKILDKLFNPYRPKKNFCIDAEFEIKPAPQKQTKSKILHSKINASPKFRYKARQSMGRQVHKLLRRVR